MKSISADSNQDQTGDVILPVSNNRFSLGIVQTLLFLLGEHISAASWKKIAK